MAAVVAVAPLLFSVFISQNVVNRFLLIELFPISRCCCCCLFSAAAADDIALFFMFIFAMSFEDDNEVLFFNSPPSMVVVVGVVGLATFDQLEFDDDRWLFADDGVGDVTELAVDAILRFNERGLVNEGGDEDDDVESMLELVLW